MIGYIGFRCESAIADLGVRTPNPLSVTKWGISLISRTMVPLFYEKVVISM